MHTPERSYPPLWDSAVVIYTQNGVASLCLRLQDEHQLNVPMVLTCVWLAYCGHAIDPARLDMMFDAAAPINARVERIRAVRRDVGLARDQEPGWKEAYSHLQTAELAGERVEMRAIERAVLGAMREEELHDRSDARQRALDGLHRYARRAGASSCDALLEDLATLALDPLLADD